MRDQFVKFAGEAYCTVWRADQRPVIQDSVWRADKRPVIQDSGIRDSDLGIWVSGFGFRAQMTQARRSGR